jgi:rhodanese-related sulfurtransferase
VLYLLAVVLATATVLGPLPASAIHGDAGVLVTPVESAKRLLDSGGPVIFIDLRSEAEYREGRIPGAKSIPLPDLRRRHGEIPRVGRAVLYCACPLEQIQAAFQFLWDRGYRNVSVLDEGFRGWVKRQYPLER